MRIYSGCDISPRAKIGRNLTLPHPIGIVIGEGVVVGDNVMIWQHVTLGSKGRTGEPFQYPSVGNNVRIFVGATVIGSVRIGVGATVGAHSLVLHDVPDHATVAGCPASVIRCAR